jgi:hypothetical protein
VPLACTSQRLNEAATNPDLVPAPPLYSGFIFNPADNTFKPLFPPAEGVMISDLVAVQSRTPLWIKATGTARPLLAEQGVAVLSIRSVYDFDGSVAHTTLAAGSGSCPAMNRSIANLANPALCLPDDRPARFIRIEEAVPRYDRQLDMTLPDINFGSAVGSGVGFMRAILGYAPIEPDGSVSVRVPANVPFTFSILDKEGRRLPNFARHGPWLQLRPGEERHCNGCHEAPTGNAMERSHGRDGISISAWAGTDAGLAFPGTLPAVAVVPQTGDTMALARARSTCIGGGTACSEIPRVNLLEVDFWNTPDPMTGPPELVNLRYGGADGVPVAPTSAGCQLNWSSTCRIVINYETHIHPLWLKTRQDMDPNDPSVVLRDYTCTNCHAPADPKAWHKYPKEIWTSRMEIVTRPLITRMRTPSWSAAAIGRNSTPMAQWCSSPSWSPMARWIRSPASPSWYRSWCRSPHASRRCRHAVQRASSADLLHLTRPRPLITHAS